MATSYGLPFSNLLGKVIGTVWFQNKWTITQDYGPTSFSHEPAVGMYPHFHTGIDLAGANIGGQPVLSGVEGVITAVGYDASGYGNYIKISPTNDPNTTILLGHLKDQIGNGGAKLQKGDGVHLGDITGHVDSTGNSTGNHLHFEVRQNGIPVNPIAYLEGSAMGQAGAPLAGDSAAQKAAAAPNSLLPGLNLGSLPITFPGVAFSKIGWIALGGGLMLLGLLLYFKAGGEEIPVVSQLEESAPQPREVPISFSSVQGGA